MLGSAWNDTFHDQLIYLFTYLIYFYCWQCCRCPPFSPFHLGPASLRPSPHYLLCLWDIYTYIFSGFSLSPYPCVTSLRRIDGQLTNARPSNTDPAPFPIAHTLMVSFAALTCLNLYCSVSSVYLHVFPSAVTARELREERDIHFDHMVLV